MVVLVVVVSEIFLLLLLLQDMNSVDVQIKMAIHILIFIGNRQLNRPIIQHVNR